MTPRLIVGIAALACGSVCGLVASLANFKMVDEVNDKLSKEQQFALLGWYFSKFQRLNREYKRVYPKRPPSLGGPHNYGAMFAAKLNVAADGRAAALGGAHVMSHYFGT